MSAPASALYPLVYQFLVASSLDKAAKKLKASAGFDLEATPIERSLADIYALYVANLPKTEDGSVKKKKSKKEKKEPTAEEVAASNAVALTALVHQFLVTSGQTKAASKITADDSAAGDKPLLEIYNLYLANQPAKASKRKAEDAEEKVEESSKKSKKSKKAKEEPVAEEAKVEAAEEPKSKKDKKKSKKEAAPTEEAAPEAAPATEENDKKKKSKKDKKEPKVEEDKEEKKPKVEEPEAEPEPAPSPVSGDESNGKKSKKDKGPKKTPAPFQRVSLDETIESLPDLDNSFLAGEIGRGTSWAQKAHEALIVTKGKGFRHEKTKKKRGTYRGGELETGVRSIKFD